MNPRHAPFAAAAAAAAAGSAVVAGGVVAGVAAGVAVAGEGGGGDGDGGEGDGDTPNTAVYVPVMSFGSLYVPAVFWITASSAWPSAVSPSFVSTELL